MAQSDSDTSNIRNIDSLTSIQNELTELEKLSAYPTTDFDVGDIVCAVSNPTVEALIIGKAINPLGQLEFVLLLPPYKRKGETATPAAVLWKNLNKLSKRCVRRYTFPLPKLEKWKTQIRKYKSDYSWTTATIQILNDESNVLVDGSPKDTPNTQIDENQALLEDATEPDLLQQMDKQLIQHLRRQILELQQKRPSIVDLPMCPDSDSSSHNELRRPSHKRTKRRNRTKILKKHQKSKTSKKSKKHPSTSTDETTDKESSTDSTFSSSSSDDDSSSADEFSCPFSPYDTRGSVHLKARMKGRKTERKYVRSALHNLYSTFNSLKCVVNDIRAQSLVVGTKPLTFDLIWLEQHAVPAYMQQTKVTEAGILIPSTNPYKKWQNINNNPTLNNSRPTPRLPTQTPLRQNAAQSAKPTVPTQVQ